MRSMLVWLTVISYFSVVTLAAATGLAIDYPKWFLTESPWIMATIALLIYTRSEGYKRLYDVAEIFLFHLLLLFPACIAPYIAMHLAFPLADKTLASMDAAIGFNWAAVVHFIDSSKDLSWLLDLAYSSFTIQVAACPVILALTNETLRAQKMLIAYFLIIALSAVASIEAPALGTFASAGPMKLHHINTWSALLFVEPLLSLRSDPNYILTPAKLAGIFSFPSVHAAMALLLAWAYWETKWLRYPALILNILMVISAIPYGSHYMVDILAGLGITVAVLTSINLLEKQSLLQNGLRLRPLVN